MNKDQTQQILDYLVAELGKTLGDMNARIKALEADGEIAVLESIEAGQEYKNGTLAQHRNGLFAVRDGKWACVANSVADISVKENGAIIFEMSDGTVIEKAITSPKPPRRKVTKVVEAAA